MSGTNDDGMGAGGYFAQRGPAWRIALAVLATGGVMAAAYLVAALLLAALIATGPALTLTGWFPWVIAFVQAVPLYAGAWQAARIGVRIAASAPMRPGWARAVTVMALPCLITIVLAVLSSRNGWFAGTVAVIVVVAGGAIGSLRRAG